MPATLVARGRVDVLQAEIARLVARFELICEATTDGLWDVQLLPAGEADQRYRYWLSAQGRRLLGIEDMHANDDFRARWVSLLHPDDVERVLAAFRAYVRDPSGATPYAVSYRLRMPDGQYRWFEARGKAVRARDGRLQAVAGALTDITDRNAIIHVKRYAEAIIANLPSGLLILDAQLKVREANRAFLQIVGADASQLAGCSMAEVLRVAGLEEAARAALAQGQARHGIEIAYGDKHLRLAMSGIDLDGEHLLLLVAEDVTAEQQLRAEAREHAQRHRDQAALLDQARDAIVVRGIDGTVQFWNKSAERIYGWHADEVLGRSTDTLLHPDPATPAAAAHAVLTQGEWSGELTQLRRDGTTLAVEAHWTLVRDEQGQPKAILAINTDVTERKASDERIRSLALYDVLTGLPNRTLFADRLAHALAGAGRSGMPLAVLFLDLNRFKEINDTQGHGVGDQVLVQVAQRLLGALRRDETLARLAGDEFVVIAERVDAHGAARIAQRLEQSMVEPIATQNDSFSVGLSIGIARYPVDGTTAEEMLRCADVAMYQAKAAGGGSVFYTAEMSVGLSERMEMARDLGRALRENRLELYYQPQLCLHSGRLVGAEALLRWHDPQRGWVSPGVFVPIAEARGMIGALGAWVLDTACRQLAAWRADGLAFHGRLAVNLAAQQLDQHDMVDSVRAIAAGHGIAATELALELTESGLMANVDKAIAAMDRLKLAGFSIAIDDFGTGYSSLAYLKRLPADKLKIDISFVREMLTDRHDYTIVNTIIGMARNLGLKVIAEGVEQEAQAETLRALGCDEAQGYLFGRPEPAAAFARRWLGAA